MTSDAPATTPLPRIIWMIWFQGWEHAPAIAQACRRTWEVMNPGWTVRALSSADLGHFVRMDLIQASIGGKRIEPEALSDVFRIALLERHGGVWADSTVYCLRPLDDWLPAVLTSGFFAFARPKPDRMVASWFLAATRGHHIAASWHARVQHYWRHRAARDHYFWFHYLFAECHDSDALFRQLWARTPQISADGPHHYVPYHGLSAPLDARDRALISGAATPMLKLTHRLPAAQYAADSVLSYLIGRALEPSRFLT